MRWLVITWLLFGFAGEASAFDLMGGAEALKPNYCERGIVLPPGVARIDVGNIDYSIHDLTFGGGVGGYIVGGEFGAVSVTGRFPSHGNQLGLRISNSGDVGVGLGIGGAYGIMENLEAGITLLPLNFAPKFAFGDIQLYGRYAFLNEETFSVAGQLTLNIPTGTRFGFALDVPAILRLSDMMRLETGLDFNLFVDPTFASLVIPAALTIGLLPELWVGVRTGLTLPDFDFDLFGFPLGLFAGYSLQGSAGPLVDLTFQFIWPGAITPGGASVANFDIFTITLGATFFLGV